MRPSLPKGDACQIMRQEAPEHLWGILYYGLIRTGIVYQTHFVLGQAALSYPYKACSVNVRLLTATA